MPDCKNCENTDCASHPHYIRQPSPPAGPSAPTLGDLRRIADRKAKWEVSTDPKQPFTTIDKSCKDGKKKVVVGAHLGQAPWPVDLLGHPPMSSAELDRAISILGAKWPQDRRKEDRARRAMIGKPQPSSKPTQTQPAKAAEAVDRLPPEPKKSEEKVELPPLPDDWDKDDDGQKMPSTESQNAELPPAPEEPRYSPRQGHGGIYMTWDGTEELDAAGQRDAQRMVDTLERLFKAIEVGIGIEPSPRISPKRLIRELVSRAPRLARARREEMQRGLIIVSSDVSGSCAAAAPATMAAVRALTLKHENVLGVVHSNGHVQEVKGARASQFPLFRDDPYAWWQEHVSYPKFTGMVAFGDWDAGESYQYVAESGVPFIWLDSLTSEYDESGTDLSKAKPANRNFTQGTEAWKIRPLAHWTGIASVHAAAYALRQITRIARRGIPAPGGSRRRPRGR